MLGPQVTQVLGPQVTHALPSVVQTWDSHDKETFTFTDPLTVMDIVKDTDEHPDEGVPRASPQVQEPLSLLTWSRPPSPLGDTHSLPWQLSRPV